MSTEVSSQKVMKFRVLKVERANSTMSGSLKLTWLQVLKVCDLKLLCPSQLSGLKDRKIKVGFQNENYDR
jgi:hypothetical protein